MTFLTLDRFLDLLKETTKTRTWYIDEYHQGIRTTQGECPICAVLNDMQRSPNFFKTNFHTAQVETAVEIEDDYDIVNAADGGSQDLRSRMIDVLHSALSR